MATGRDLAEAHAFGRRRLTQAFIAGAPGGHEVEPPPGPLRVAVGGAALAVLLVAGTAIAGIVTQSTPEDRAEPGPSGSRETVAASCTSPPPADDG